MADEPLLFVSRFDYEAMIKVVMREENIDRDEAQKRIDKAVRVYGWIPN